MSNITNIDSFKKGRGKFKETLLILLEKINTCCKLLISENPAIENNENIIRNRLLKDYLNNPEIRMKLNIKSFIFAPESAEIDDGYKEAGYTDIKVFLPLTFTEPRAYYILECKRLDGNKTLNKAYILEGILRFVSNKYSTYFGVNGMIAFLVKAIDTEKNINRINELCAGEFPQTNTKREIRSAGKPGLYESIHSEDKTGKPITLYHLMADFSIVSRVTRG